MSLHTVAFTLKFADRIVGLREGRIQFDLPANNVTQTVLLTLYQNGSTDA